MCRMFGIGGGGLNPNVLKCIEHLKSGGPDEQNIRFSNRWLLGHTRLSINGIRNGSQPYSLDGLQCVFVGQIYNHRELSRTYSIARRPGDADGAVILPLFERFGPGFVSKLEGMFSGGMS